MPHTLPPLPYATDALEPHISARTLQLHHGTHHRKYVETLNELVAGTRFESLSLADTIRETHGRASEQKVFNNAGQAWNHAFFWPSLSPEGGGAPGTALAPLIDAAFGSFDAFRARFVQEGAAHFGSGWVWLVLKAGRVDVVSTHDAGQPQLDGATPLLVCDLWEHAYYLDYQAERKRFLETFLDHLVNWTFADGNLRESSITGDGRV